MRRLSIVLFSMAALAACGDPEARHPDGSLLGGDSGRPMGDPPAKPTLDPYESRVPYSVATLRGRVASGTRRILVEGGRNTIATSVLPDSSFCVDVPMPEPWRYEFHLSAQADDGATSLESALAVVEFDPMAPAVPSAQTCNGADPAGCASDEEVCDNGRDDDCNSLIDEHDPACAQCEDDLLEPNDDISAPRVTAGRYEMLHLCPGDDDYYGLFARRGQTIAIRLYFAVDDGNLDVALVGPDRSTVVERGTATTDDEVVDFMAPEEGEYKLHVFGVEGAGNTYILDVTVSG